jgi:ubiquinol-cytochrome c reductase cytochrome b subunit
MGVAFMGVAFLRYVLPYGQMSYWRATVIINLLSVVSYWVCVVLWGRFVVSEFTVTRFYVLHFLIPLALAILILRHLHLLHVSGGSSLSYSSQKISFFPFLMVKDAVIWCVYFIFFVLLVCVYSNTLGDAENFILANSMVTPIHIKPEWYFLFAYAILRCIPDKTTGVLALAASVVLPVCRILRKGQRGLSSVGFFSYVFIWLTVFRGMPILLHYYFGSQVLSVLYFIYVLVFL